MADKDEHPTGPGAGEENDGLHKPVKPAALRVLLAQWRVRHATAAE